MLQRQRAMRMRMRRARVALERRRLAFKEMWMALQLLRQATIRLVMYISRVLGWGFPQALGLLMVHTPILRPDEST